MSTYDGFDLAVHDDPDAVDDADTVVVPGYARAWSTTPADSVRAALQRASGRGTRMLSICVGAFALGHAGILRGRRATTHWAATSQLAALT